MIHHPQQPRAEQRGTVWMWSPQPQYLHEATKNHEKPRSTGAVVTCGFFPEIFYWISWWGLFYQECQGRRCCWLMLILSSPLPQENNHIAVAFLKLKDKGAPRCLPSSCRHSCSPASVSPDKWNCRLFTAVMMGRRRHWSYNWFSITCVGFDFLVPGCAYKATCV